MSQIASVCRCGGEMSRCMFARVCNCSICKMKGNVHFMAPKDRLKLLSGEDSLSSYTFGTHTAKVTPLISSLHCLTQRDWTFVPLLMQHLFCKVCGVTPYYSPRSNPDCWAVTVACLDRGTVATVTNIDFDGTNWEASYSATGIAAQSKQ